MNGLRAQWTHQGASAWVAGVAATLFVALGFRGFGHRGLEWVEAAGPLLTWVPGLHPGWMAAILGLLSGVVSTVLVFVLARRLGGAVCGWLAVVMVMTASPWLGIFTRGDPGALVVPLVLTLVLLWFGGLRWWLASLLGGLVLALGFLVWPPFLVVAGLLVLLSVASPSVAGRAPSRVGLSGGAGVPLGRVFILFVAGGLLVVISLLGGTSPGVLMGSHVEALLLTPPETLLFRGGVYPPSRPPLYFGIALCLEALPLLTALSVVSGLLFFASGHDFKESQDLARGLVVLSVLMFVLPVMLRSYAPGGVEAAGLFLGLAAPLGARSVSRFFVTVLSVQAPTMKVRQVAIAVFWAAAISVLVEVPRGIVMPEAHRSALTARLVGWSQEGDQALREVVLPLRLLRQEGGGPGKQLWSSGWEAHLRVYKAMGMVSPGAITSSAEDATWALRPVPAVRAGPFGVFPAAHRPGLEGAQVESWPSASRPVFLIDRLPEF